MITCLMCILSKTSGVKQSFLLMPVQACLPFAATPRAQISTTTPFKEPDAKDAIDDEGKMTSLESVLVQIFIRAHDVNTARSQHALGSS
jgi:hypothetical protein